jgi:hypothetical protein
VSGEQVKKTSPPWAGKLETNVALESPCFRKTRRAERPVTPVSKITSDAAGNRRDPLASSSTAFVFNVKALKYLTFI